VATCTEAEPATKTPIVPKINAVPVGLPYAELSAEVQVAQDQETDTTVTQAQQEIKIDSGIDGDYESDLGYETDSIGSASISLASSMRDFAFENGRRYHRFREGAYNFPNDDCEQEREDMKHAMMVNLLGGRLHFASIGDKPQICWIWVLAPVFGLLRVGIILYILKNFSNRTLPFEAKIYFSGRPLSNLKHTRR